jgi:hypothetical protein
MSLHPWTEILLKEIKRSDYLSDQIEEAELDLTLIELLERLAFKLESNTNLSRESIDTLLELDFKPED